MGKFLTISEFADKIGVHVQTLRDWDSNGKLKPHHKTPGGRRYYTMEQAEQYTAEHSQFLSINEFAKEIGVHPQTLRRWDESNQLKPHHKNKKGTRWYTKSQVYEYLNQN